MTITYETTEEVTAVYPNLGRHMMANGRHGDGIGKHCFKYHAFEIGDSKGKLGIVIAQNSVKALDEGHNIWGEQDMYAMNIPGEDLRESVKGMAL